MALQPRETAWMLSIGGFVPFASFAAALFFWSEDHQYYSLAVDGMKTYGAVILSFLGGTRWGIATRKIVEDGVGLTYVAAVIPALVGWFSLLLPTPHVFAALAVMFVVQGVWDVLSVRNRDISPWFAKLRVTLTLLVTSSLGLAWLATAP